MKKIIVAIFLFVLVCIPFSQSLAGIVDTIQQKGEVVESVSLSTEQTDMRNAIEFCELFAHRIDILKYEKQYNCDWELGCFSVITSWLSTDELSINSAGGQLIVTADKLEIKELITTLVDSNADENKSIQHTMSAMIALSVLEFDATDDDFIGFSYELGLEDSKDAVDKALNLWVDEISPLFDDAFFQRINNGEEVLVYSGNYNYYVSRLISNHNGTAIDVIHLYAYAK